MQRCLYIAWASVVLLSAVSCAQSGGAKTMLGISDSMPVIFTELSNGMTVKFANVTFDKFGRMESYDASIGGPAGARVIKVHPKGPAVYGKPAEYEAELNGKVLPNLQPNEKPGVMGFTLKAPGGVILTYVGTVQIEMKSELGYDPSGRQQVSKQTFAHAGKEYVVEYGDYSYDKNGRLVTYTATVKKAG